MKASELIEHQLIKNFPDAELAVRFGDDYADVEGLTVRVPDGRRKIELDCGGAFKDLKADLEHQIEEQESKNEELESWLQQKDRELDELHREAGKLEEKVNSGNKMLKLQSDRIVELEEKVAELLATKEANE